MNRTTVITGGGEGRGRALVAARNAFDITDWPTVTMIAVTVRSGPDECTDLHDRRG